MDKNTDISITSNKNDESSIKVMNDMMKAANIKDYEVHTVTIDIKKNNRPYEPVSFLKVFYEEDKEDSTFKYDTCIVYYVKDDNIYYLPPEYSILSNTRYVKFTISDCNTYCLVYVNEKDLEGLEDVES